MIPSHERTDPGAVSRSDADGGQEVRRGAGSFRGLFIVFEGGDGAGKTTQVNLLCTALQQRGHDVLATREPGDTWLGGQIRHLVLSPDSGGISPKAEALLYNADKAQHLAEVVRPALDQGRIVVSDRYVDSTIAYQGAGRALSVDEVARLAGWATDDLVPDLTVLLDVDPATAAERMDGRDRMESAGDEFHRRVRDNFLELARRGGGRYLVVPAQLTAEQIAAQVLQRVALLTAGDVGAPCEVEAHCAVDHDAASHGAVDRGGVSPLRPAATEPREAGES